VPAGVADGELCELTVLARAEGVGMFRVCTSSKLSSLKLLWIRVLYFLLMAAPRRLAQSRVVRLGRARIHLAQIHHEP
jgi:hypothetical protein